MSDITIVTAFFDIGRGDWTPDKGLPHYLERSTDTYFQRFSYMASLDNDMVIYTSPDLAQRVNNLRKSSKGKTTIFPVSLDHFSGLRNEIAEIQNMPSYKQMINTSQVKNPEYWSPEYVMVNLMKCMFVSEAIRVGVVDTELVSWLDLGYCREQSATNGIKKWSYPFNPEKIHMFNFMEYDDRPVTEIIANNIVYMFGASIVAGKEKWEKFYELITGAYINLLNANLVDDDQTYMLLAYLYEPESFELHKISYDNPFIVFKEFSE